MNINKIPADKTFDQFFIPSERTTLDDFHDTVKDYILDEYDETDVYDFLNNERWRLGQERGDTARAGAIKVQRFFLSQFPKNKTQTESKLRKMIQTEIKKIISKSNLK